MLDSFTDFETRSLLSIGDVGAWKYAKHQSTYPLMFSYICPYDGKVIQWLEYKHGRDCPASFREIVEDSDVVFHAHNAGFEIAIYWTVCRDRWGWPDIPLDRWKDTAAKGCHANLPRSLGDLCERIGADERKDKNGKALLNLLCGPQKAVKVTKKKGVIRTDSIKYLQEHGIELFEVPGKNGLFYWNNDPKKLAELAKYNRQDIVAERDVDKMIPDFPDAEQDVWVLDQMINRRGIPIDRALCKGVKRVFAVEADICNAKITAVAHETDGRPDKEQVTASTQNKRILNWVKERVNFGESIGKDFVEAWMKKPWGVHDPDQAERVRDIFTLRQIAGGTGVKKYWAALDFIEDDDRCRGQLLFYGAATGRWAGKGIQPHNMVRLPIPEEIFFEAITRGNHDEVKALAHVFGYNVNELLKTCVRGLIRAPVGQQLVVSDFAGIEARVLQWFAGNEEALQMFRNGAEMYCYDAAKIFGVPYEDMVYWDEKEKKYKCKKQYKEQRQVGKIAVLALGYQMGADKYRATCENFGVKIDAAFAQEIVQKWRAANSKVVDLWRRVDRACKAVIKDRSKKTKAKIDDYLRIYWDKRGYLCIRLPSGRVLYYYRARLGAEGDFGRPIEYLDGGKQWVDTYGGKIVENIIQAASRDLLVNSMFLAHHDGLELIMHVHDELVALTPLTDTTAHDRLHKAMSTVPRWAAGLPLEAETYTSERYTKV